MLHSKIRMYQIQASNIIPELPARSTKVCFLVCLKYSGVAAAVAIILHERRSKKIPLQLPTIYHTSGSQQLLVETKKASQCEQIRADTTANTRVWNIYHSDNPCKQLASQSNVRIHRGNVVQVKRKPL
ncbi:hypothetical protein BCR34DRAFT_275240 [Clohesyomyces aquaticus]|uniref:Uncharacterized protein n=1 Tax=Clohesyomyces aquaticus TaxID=1231657 RepID=A0A1Y1ZSE3_9PLEO|nr:hypothetical protein BCR34DRAFT_275240 [Clohesyomyces aquaticus]